MPNPIRGDIKSRFEAYKIAWMNGWMTQNEIRRRENMPTLGAPGDVIWVPANMQPAKRALKLLEEPEPGDGRGEGQHPPPPPSRPAAPVSAAPPGGEGAREAHRLLVVQDLAKLLKRETRAARRAASNARGWNGWLDTWYTSHETKLRARLEALAASTCELYGRDKSDAARIAGELAAAHVGRARELLLDLAGRATAQNLSEHVGRWADQWDAERASELAGQLAAAAMPDTAEQRKAA